MADADPGREEGEGKNAPQYPRFAIDPLGWTGIICVRMIPKKWEPGPGPPPGRLFVRRVGEPLVLEEVCRGPIVGGTGEERCAWCGAVPSWVG